MTPRFGRLPAVAPRALPGGSVWSGQNARPERPSISHALKEIEPQTCGNGKPAARFKVQEGRMTIQHFRKPKIERQKALVKKALEPFIICSVNSYRRRASLFWQSPPSFLRRDTGLLEPPTLQPSLRHFLLSYIENTTWCTPVYRPRPFHNLDKRGSSLPWSLLKQARFAASNAFPWSPGNGPVVVALLLCFSSVSCYRGQTTKRGANMTEIDNACPVCRGAIIRALPKIADMDQIACNQCGGFRITGTARRIACTRSYEERKLALQRAHRMTMTGQLPIIGRREFRERGDRKPVTG